METKSNPNPNGCYARAMPDEPMFILLGRDVAAPGAIRGWAELRLKMPSADADLGQIQEALATADSFENWRIDHDGEWRGHQPHLPDQIPTPTDEISSIAGRIMGTKARMPTSGAKTTLEMQFDRLLEDAKRLAGFVMRSDREAGPNDGE